MKTICILVLVFAALCYGSPLVISGRFTSANPVLFHQKAICYDHEKKSYHQNYLNDISNTLHVFIPNTNGKAFHVTEKTSGAVTKSYVNYHDGIQSDHIIGGADGEFSGDEIQKIVTDGATTYACGDFTKVGKNIEVQAGSIVKFEVDPSKQYDPNTGEPWHSIQWTETPIHNETGEFYKFSCYTMFMVGNKLYVKDSRGINPSPFYTLDGDTWKPVTANIHIPTWSVIKGNVAYILGKDVTKNATDTVDEVQFIQKYDGKSWSTLIEPDNYTRTMVQFAIGETEDEVYATFKNDEYFSDKYRNEKIYKYDKPSKTWNRIGKEYFSIDGSIGGIITSANLNIIFDPGMKKLLVLSWSGIKYLLYGNREDQYDVYSKIVNYIVYYDEETNSFKQAFGGGPRSTPESYQYVDNMTCWYATQAGAYEDKVDYIGKIDAKTNKLIPLFGTEWKGLDFDVQFDSTGEIAAYAPVSEKEAYIAGKFRTIDNVTMNSIAFINSDGKATPLGKDEVGVRIIPYSSDDRLITRRAGTINSMVYLPRRGEIYVAGEFNYAGNHPAHNIAKYTIATEEWTSISHGTTKSNKKMIYSEKFNSLFLIIESNEYIGNQKPYGIVSYHIGKNEWNTMNTGLDTVQDLVEYNGGILASGSTDGTTGSTSFSYWDGENWSRLHTKVPQSKNDENTCYSGHKCVLPAAGSVEMKPVSSGKFWFLNSVPDDHLIQYNGENFVEMNFVNNHKLDFSDSPRIGFDENGHLQLFSGVKRRIINTNNFNLLRMDENFVNDVMIQLYGSATKSIASVALTIIAVVMLLL